MTEHTSSENAYGITADELKYLLASACGMTYAQQTYRFGVHKVTCHKRMISSAIKCGEKSWGRLILRLVAEKVIILWDESTDSVTDQVEVVCGPTPRRTLASLYKFWRENPPDDSKIRYITDRAKQYPLRAGAVEYLSQLCVLVALGRYDWTTFPEQAGE